MTNYLNFLIANLRINYEKMKDKLNHSSIQINDYEQNILAEIARSGVVVIPNYYSIQLCDEIIAELDRMLNDQSVNVWKDDIAADNRVYASHKHSKLIENYFTDPFLAKMAEAYLRSPIINSHTLGAKLTARKDNLGSGGGWHRDSVYRIQFKSILYLTDVAIENGPFEYILGTQNKNTVYKSILNNKFKAHQNRISEKQVEDFMTKNKGFEKKIFTAEKGTLILVDTSGIHRGMPISEGKRYALTNYFFPKHHYSKKSQMAFEKLF